MQPGDFVRVNTGPYQGMTGTVDYLPTPAHVAVFLTSTGERKVFHPCNLTIESRGEPATTEVA